MTLRDVTLSLTCDSRYETGFPRPERSFRVLFCTRFKCPDADYERLAFRKLLHTQAKLFAAIIYGFSPGFFAEDFKFIGYLGDSMDLRDANATIADFQDLNKGTRGFLRTRLRIRVSGFKATELARLLFAGVSRDFPGGG